MITEVLPLILSFLATIVSIYCVFRIEKTEDNMMNHLDEQLEKTFSPIQQKVNRSMTIKSEQATEARQVRTLDRRIANDIINMQDPLIQGALEMFPNAKEYVNKNPELILKLLPRLQALGQIENFNPMDIISPSPSLGNSPSPSNARARLLAERG